MVKNNNWYFIKKNKTQIKFPYERVINNQYQISVFLLIIYMYNRISSN